MRTKARTDANQQAIVDAFRHCGAKVFDLSGVGRGCPDLLVYAGQHLVLIEAKARKGTLTPKQIAFHAEWPVIVVRDVAMVPAIIRGLVRRGTMRSAQEG